MIERLPWSLSVFISRWRNRFRYLLAAHRVYRNWWAWTLPKFGVGIVLELRSGLRDLVRARTTDLGTINDAVINNPYLGGGILKLPKDAVIVDVGANIGDFSIQAATACSDGQVFAIEPIAENASMILVNQLLNGVSNVRVLQAALGARAGEIEMNRAGNASSAYWGATGARTEKVRLMSLAEMMRECRIEAIDLLKLDCEGAEWDILPSCAEILPKVRQIGMEFHLSRGWTAEKLASWLRDRGYKVKHTGGGWNVIFMGDLRRCEVNRTGRKRKLMRRIHLYFEARDGAGIYFRKLLASMLIMAAACAAPGCAETPRQRAKRIEPMLSAAGFHMHQADTPQRQEELASRTPLKVRYYLRDGKPHYWFADPTVCQCIYIGTEHNYQNYEQIRLQQRTAQREEAAAMINEDAAQQEQMNFMMWPGEPFFY